jgi:hypothetical protein
MYTVNKKLFVDRLMLDGVCWHMAVCGYGPFGVHLWRFTYFEQSYDYDISRLSMKNGRMEKELIDMNLTLLKF